MMSILTSVFDAQKTSSSFNSEQLKMNIKSFTWMAAGIGVFFLCVVAIASKFFTGTKKGNATSFLQKSGSSTEKRLFLPDEEDIVDDVGTGLKIIKDVINITFSSKTSHSTIQKIIDSVNGEIVGYDKAVNLYQVKIANADLPTIDNIRTKLLSKYKEVEVAARCSVSVHTNPYYIK